MTYVTPRATSSVNINGRVYAANPGQVLDVPVADAAILSANGWDPVPDYTAIKSMSNSVSDSPPTSSNNYSPANYVPGTTTRLLLTAASGGSTLTGLVAPPFDGFQMLVVNMSATDTITFAHLSGSSAVGNKFSCAGAAALVVAALGTARLNYVGNVWKFG